MTVFGVFRHVVLLAGAVVVLAPFVWLLSLAVKPADEIFTTDIRLLPQRWDAVRNFTAAFEKVPLHRYLLNGVIVTASIFSLQVLIALPAAYALAKLRFGLARPLFALVLLGLLIPGHVPAIPHYILLSQAGLLNTYPALVMPSIISVFGIFWIRQALRLKPIFYGLFCRRPLPTHHSIHLSAPAWAARAAAMHAASPASAEACAGLVVVQGEHSAMLTEKGRRASPATPIARRLESETLLQLLQLLHLGARPGWQPAQGRQICRHWSRRRRGRRLTFPLVPSQSTFDLEGPAYTQTSPAGPSFHVRDIQASGVTKLKDIAAALQARGIRTPRGHANWQPAQVARLLA